MPTPSWDNPDAFLSIDDFALEANVTPQGGVSRPVRGIFDEPYFNAQLGEYEADSSEPRLTCNELDVKDLAPHDSVEVAGRAYYLATYPQLDGTGLAVLRLVPE
ncbi:head-tail joining protein [Tritonibacter mobilis]|uniref:head-tail joining protein n=1 Tax=Tritonibacter mobilis TaxID=379347 RepID=UPI00080683C7|nr:hypothetical protein [Tritonibacter mobilis]